MREMGWQRCLLLRKCILFRFARGSALCFLFSLTCLSDSVSLSLPVLRADLWVCFFRFASTLAIDIPSAGFLMFQLLRVEITHVGNDFFPSYFIYWCHSCPCSFPCRRGRLWRSAYSRRRKHLVSCVLHCPSGRSAARNIFPSGGGGMGNKTGVFFCRGIARSHKLYLIASSFPLRASGIRFPVVPTFLQPLHKMKSNFLTREERNECLSFLHGIVPSFSAAALSIRKWRQSVVSRVRATSGNRTERERSV